MEIKADKTYEMSTPKMVYISEVIPVGWLVDEANRRKDKWEDSTGETIIKQTIERWKKESEAD